MKCAIMFADIVGSTQLYEKLGDAVATDCINQCVQKMTEIAQINNGVLVKTVGDEIMCRFTSADDAVAAAVNLHERFSREPLEELNLTISLRIGIQYGETIERGDDVFGDAVNVASRMTNIAIANQIITTEDAVAQLSSQWSNKTRLYDRIEVKGKHDRIVIHEVIWEDRNITMIRNSTASMAVNQSLHFIYQGLTKTIQQNSQAFVLGRSPENNLVIEAPLVSRVHAYCVYRRGKFILIDQSTNGTYVKTGEGREIYLRREELPLVGRGLIGLGETASRDNGQIIQYICV